MPQKLLLIAATSLALPVQLNAAEPSREPKYLAIAEQVSNSDLAAWIRKSGSSDPAQKDEWKALGQFTGTESLARKSQRIAELKQLGVEAPAHVAANCGDLPKCRIFVLASFMTPFAADPYLDVAITEADATLSRVLGFIRQDKCGSEIAGSLEEYHRSLRCRDKRDQAVRQVAITPPAADTEQVKAAVMMLLFELMMWSDIDNSAWLERNLDKFGWPESGKASSEVSEAAWIIVQHSDFDQPFQLRVLRRLGKLVEKGEAEGRHYAFLYDRVWGELAGKQRYGTQWVCKDDKMVMQDLEDEKALSSLRKSVGLGPSVPPKINTCSTDGSVTSTS